MPFTPMSRLLRITVVAFALCWAMAAFGESPEPTFKQVKAKAEAGDKYSEGELGRRYPDGQGVAKDDVEAVKWFRKAAEQNFSQAQYTLSANYYNGEMVAKDYVEAYKWALLAAAQGHEDAKKLVAWLDNHQMTRDQIAEGQRL